jgi:AbrB family looped-hinge helix DNA binding protein
MTSRTKIQDGQIVVPSRLRRLAGLAEGDPLDVTFEQGKLVMVAPVRSARTAPAPEHAKKAASGVPPEAPNVRTRIPEEDVGGFQAPWHRQDEHASD